MPKPHPSDPYVAGLQLLARRELSVAQLRARLRRWAYPDQAVEHAVERLRVDRALDDRRTALAYARTATRLTLRSRSRILSDIEARGIDAETARAALDAAADERDESEILERALARRLHGPIEDARHVRRLHRSLRRLGFPTSMIVAALKRRTGTPAGDPEA